MVWPGDRRERGNNRDTGDRFLKRICHVEPGDVAVFHDRIASDFDRDRSPGAADDQVLLDDLIHGVYRGVELLVLDGIVTVPVDVRELQKIEEVPSLDRRPTHLELRFAACELVGVGAPRTEQEDQTPDSRSGGPNRQHNAGRHALSIDRTLGLHHRRRGQRGLCAGEPAVGGSERARAAARSRRQGRLFLDRDPVGYLYTIANPRTDWCYKTEPTSSGRPFDSLRARPRAGRLLLHQRHDLHARTEGPTTITGPRSATGLVLGRGAAALQAHRGLRARRRRDARGGRRVARRGARA